MIQGTSQTERKAPQNLGVVYLLKQLRDEIALMLRQEFTLARAEMAHKGKTYIRNIIFIAIGAALAYTGLIFLLLAGALAIMVGLAAAGVTAEIYTWLASLMVGAVVLLIGYGLLHKGIRTLQRQSPMPQKTVRTLEENKAWLQSKTS